ncbi:MAG: hypothetical protein H0W83_01355 [Planctomycetes bacterium]|nr:hypothetical protein [Planctomycetota bacterium]
MRSPRTRSLTPLIAALLAIPACVTTAQDQSGTDPNKALEEYAQKGDRGTPEQVQAEARYREAYAQYRQAHFAEAREAVEAALRSNPSHVAAQRLRDDILAVLGQRDNRLQMAATWFKSLQDVKTQELAVRFDSLLTSGDQKMAAGDFQGAELDYDRVEVGLRSFPYDFDWGNLPEQVAGKRLEARAQSRQAVEDRDADSRREAGIKAREQADLQEQALKAKVDELIRRAKTSYQRKDYKRAEVDAWNAYELDRRREDARKLYLDSRREGHVQFDDHYRDERLERLARVNEEIHKSLIPQTEILVYPEDWQRRSLRKPREIGSAKVETWRVALSARLEERVSFEFQDQGFEEVVNFLRQVTGVNIVVAPEVIAANPPTVSLKAKDMKFGNALKLIMELTNLHYALQNQAIFISNKSISGAIVLKMYDVTDLISPARDFPGRELAYNAGAGGGSGINMFKAPDEASTPADPQQLVDFIRKNVAPKSWEEQSAEGVGIEQRSGSTLFVSQTPEVHEQIEMLLTGQRNQASLQVNVNVRLLEVRKDFFEEIGFAYNNPAGAEHLLTSNTQSGYYRENNTLSYRGVVNQSLPANQPGYDQFINPAQPHGLVVESSLNAFNYFNADQINAIFSAIEDETDAQILQHPSLTCFNGKRANASFMHQFSYIADYEVVSANLDPKIEVLTFGDILDVLPVVSSDHKYITMEVRPASVSLAGVYTETLFSRRVVGPPGDGAIVTLPQRYPLELPNVLVRTMRSSVMIPDKGSLLIGGFQHSVRQRTHTGIPFLSHIPFLGRLFSRNGTYDVNRQLYYLLNAEIVDLAEKEAIQ